MQNSQTITTDYHMHSTFSADADNTPAEMCQSALDRGLDAIAITEHAEWHPKGAWLFPTVEEYFIAIEECRERFAPLGLTVFSGVEVGNPHQYQDEAAAMLERYDFDVVIASIHWVEDENIHLQSAFTGRDATERYTEYFSQMAQMAARFDFNFVAHFDRIFSPGITVAGAPDMVRLEPVIREMLSTLARRNQGLELNTRFLAAENNWNDLLVQILTWFREEGGMHVFANSDSHRVAEVGRNRDIAQSILAQAGFVTASRLRGPSAEVALIPA